MGYSADDMINAANALGKSGKVQEFSSIKELIKLEEKDLASKKKDKLITKINTHLENVLQVIDKQDKLDYFDIIIKNHQGNITAEFVVKDKFKAY